VRWLKGLLVVLFVIAMGIAVAYVWAQGNTETSQTARVIAWLEADVDDWQRFPMRTMEAASEPLELPTPSQPDPAVSTFGIEGVALPDYLADNDTTAFLVARDGELVYEGYFNDSDREATQTSFSAAKSFASTLVGIAESEGLLALDDPVTTHIPELLDRDERFADISIGDLIAMSSGLRYEKFPPWGDQAATYYAPDLRASALDAVVVEPPGQTFLYNNYNPLLIGMVLERVTDMPVAEYLESRLWQPMGAEAEGSWSLDSETSGFEKMESGINGRAVDLMKLGLVFANDGSIEGRRIVPEAWVEWATSVDTTSDPAEEYQAFWWTLPDSDAFSAIGNHGQYIYVDPVADIVIARFGRAYGSLDYLGWTELFDDIVAAMDAPA